MHWATQLLTAATLLDATTAYKQRRYIDNSSGTPEVIIPGASSYNGLNLVPQMGWNTWNAFGCDADEELLLSSARHLVDFGLRDLGYNVISLDDCWSIGRNSSGYLVESHIPGRLAMKQDAELWAGWGADYLKYDNCFNQGQSGTPKISYDRYSVMSQALNNTSREIIYAMCNWGNDDPYDWAYLIANSGRMSGDVYDSFNRPDDRCHCTEAPGCAWPGFHCSIMNILNKMPSITSRTMSGYFNDMDGLEVGNGGQDDNEYVTHFSMWAMNSSPLMIGTNVGTLSPQNLAILSNPAIIALNQDPSAGAAIRKWRYFVEPDKYGQGEISLWTRVLDNGDTVIALLNAGNSTRAMNATIDDIFLDQRTAGAYKAPPELSETWDVYDLWANRMSNEKAQAILGDGNGTASNATMTAPFNATATSYADGLKNNVTALYGAHIGSIAPSEAFTAEIARHSVGVFRLRSRGSASPRKRDEL
ncbi:melibiase [Paraphaeosphaeria minitans]|uniref:Alpha-galactosidase n=1 Tax=Paraphaeosphaeria minitans TaxID=565426 RepID=A0A9P6GAH7_9PLEO|nr:melibiase [Paraphaeosphaeria minitans]